MVKSIYSDEDKLLEAMFGLYAPGGISVDLTFSTGRMYKKIDPKFYPACRNDLNPDNPNLTDSWDCQDAPEHIKRAENVVFDPPFLSTTGPSLKSKDKSNLIAKRFSVYRNEESLFLMYWETLKACYKVLDEGGFLFFKCQDKVSSGVNYFSHCLIYTMALRAGFYARDLFVLESKTRMVAGWQKNQQHARKYHCYWWVFEKGAKTKAGRQDLYGVYFPL